MIAKIKSIGLHWWIFGGILVGVVWGGLLNATYYEEFQHAAYQNIFGLTWDANDIIAEGRAIQNAIKESFRQTLWGGMAYGISEIFLKLLKMIVIPLVMTSLISGIAGMRDFATLRSTGIKAAGWYIMSSFLAIIAGLVVVNILRPGDGLDLSIPIASIDVPVPDSIWDMIIAIVPDNVIQSAASFDLLPLIFFSIIFGIFLLTVDDRFRTPIILFVDGLFEVMMKITLFVISLAPIGIAALIANLIASTGIDIFQSLFGYALAVTAALLLHLILTLPLLLWLFTRYNPFRIMKAMSPALLTAFSTASSAGTLPLTIQRIEHEVGVSNRTAGFVLPLGATINMDGTALYECVAVLFVAQIYASVNPDFVLTFPTQLLIVVLSLLVSIGAAGIPHAGLVMMIIIFEAVGLPLEFMAILWAIDRPLDMARTMVNVWSDTVGTIVIAHSEDKIDTSVLTSKMP